LATLLDADALPVTLMRDPKWTVILFGAEDRDGDPIWRAWMDAEKLEAEKQSYAVKGLLNLFYMEYFAHEWWPV